MADFLSRSLTTRRAKKADRVNSPPARAFSVRKPAGSNSSERVKISGPVNLISTTNMLSYHAPDIIPKGVRQATIDTYSSNASTRSTDESDHSSTSSRSRQVSTDASSLESAPTSPESHQARGGFFDPPPRADRAKALHRSASTTSLSRPGISPRSSAESQTKKSLEPKRSVDNIRQQRDVAHRTPETIPEITPEVPRRARSHSKEAHEIMARKRSVRSGQPPALSPHSRNGSKHEQRSSFDMFKHGHSSSDVDPAHPFGRELEQLNEVVEELGTTIRDVALDEDTRHMRDKGLARFCAADYLAEIAPLAAKTYKTKVSTAPTPMNTTWI
ncbi:hypothetical protein HDK77DRAFT_82132 [Phyllosticta capitalensis]|uniref:Uncharacterized protein n=1 Tax=Phyllosticta capitalensis TaxID=121624 RepID=A0ABR1YD04_9PEZI